MLNPKGIYCAYLRKSRADQEAEARGQFETLAHHQQILTALAEREGIRVAKWYRELVSGDTIQDRPEMQALLQDVRSGLYDGVLVTEVSRLARGRTADQATVSEAFQIHGTLIITPSKVYNPSDDADETFIDFELFMARQEFKYIKKRLKAGKRQAMLNGCFVGAHAPFGFDRDSKNKSLMPNQDAPFVTQLLHDFADGHITLSDAVRRIRAYTGSDTWSYMSIRYMLTNPAYCGISRIDAFSTAKVTDQDGQVITKRVMNNKPTIVKGRWDGLIDEETHQKILDRIGNAPRVKAGHVLRNPFAGLMRCGKCGRLLHLDTPPAGNPRIVHSHGVMAYGCRCTATTIPVLLEGLADALEQGLPNMVETFEDEPKPVDPAPIKKKLAELTKKQGKLYDLFEDGIYSAEEFRARRQMYQEQIEALEGQINALGAKKKRPPVTVSTADAVRLIRDPSTPPKVVNDFLKSIIDHIDYFRDSAKEEPRLIIYPKL